MRPYRDLIQECEEINGGSIDVRFFSRAWPVVRSQADELPRRMVGRA